MSNVDEKSKDVEDIWFVLPVLESGGAERVVAELVRRLPARGFRARVICLEDERAPVGAALTKEGFAVQGLRISRRHSLKCARKLSKLLAAEKPRIVHGHLFHANLVTRLAHSRLLGNDDGYAPVVLSTVHVQEQRFRPWQFKLDKYTMQWCSREVCVSASVEKFHRAKTGLPESFFHVIENGVDTKRFHPLDDIHRLEVRAKLGLDGNRKMVLAVGRLDPQKDHKALLDAWRLADFDAEDDAELWIAGEGSERARLESDLPGGVRLLGFRSDIPELMAACDLFVQPSAWEGLPLTVLEAMACGCPVLASRIESHAEIIDNEVDGVLLTQGDAQEWSVALKRVLSDASLRKALSCRARVKVEDSFTIDRMVGAYARLYREVGGVDSGE